MSKKLFVVMFAVVLCLSVALPVLAEVEAYSFPGYETRNIIVGTSTTSLSFGKAGLVTFTSAGVVDVYKGSNIYVAYPGHSVSIVVAQGDVVKLTATSNTAVLVSFGPNYTHKLYVPVVVRK